MWKTAIALFTASCAIAPLPTGGQTSPPSPDRAGSLEYRNAKYGFTLRYPSTSRPVEPNDDADPGVVARVWLQDAAVAASEVARVSPPQLAVDVFDNASRRSLDEWLADRADLTARGARAPVRVGGIDGVRLTGRAQLAPNVFYFVARGPFVYRFTPLGAVGDEMLASVTFLS